MCRISDTMRGSHIYSIFIVSFLESCNGSAGLIFIHAGGEQQVNMCIMLDDYYCECFFYMYVIWRLLPNTYCILSKYLSHTSNSGSALNLKYVTERPYNTPKSEFPLCDLHNRKSTTAEVGLLLKRLSMCSCQCLHKAPYP